MTWETISAWEIIGIGCGFLVTAFLLFTLRYYMLHHWRFMADWIVGKEAVTIVILEIVEFVLSTIDFSMNVDELNSIFENLQSEEEENLIFEAIWSMSTGLFSLALAVNTIIWLEGKGYTNRNDKAQVTTIFGGLSLVFGVTFLGIGINKLYN